jgi:selenocysteine-specific elongation factor
VQVIGTAGHVDHGKSTLINRLTGINPDRLKAEQDREMSIELGFAWLQLPNGEDIGIVDVPGHRDFIENMLAGVGGIDAALFVVAADEGVMPQTREHLAILDLLQIPAGVVALTKTDLVEDPEWLDLIEADLRETLAGTVLADAPIVQVSARTGAGLDDLIQALQDILAQRPHRPDLGRPRLPVDRVFTLPGFGTIVTGTLTDGTLAVGDSVTVLPQGITGRIRGLQTHKQAEERAQPGSRTAVNVSGISVDQIRRGNVLVHPNTYQSTKMLDVWVRLLADADAPLKHNTEVKFFIGAAEVMARVRVLGTQALQPGESGFLQLLPAEPVVALRQDRFILRRPSPAATIGGGQVVDPHPKRRHKRFNQDRIAELEQLMVGTPEDVLLQTAEKTGATTREGLIEAAGLEPDQAQEALASLLANGDLVEIGSKSLLLTAEQLDRDSGKIRQALAAFHQASPLKLGMPREQLKSETGVGGAVFDAILKHAADEKILVLSNTVVRLADHEIAFTSAQQAQIDSLLAAFQAHPYAPPTAKQSLDIVSEDLLNALVATGQLVQVMEDVLLQPEILNDMRDAVIAHIRQNEAITLAELRDKFDTSRKYAVAVLEYLDETGVTIRKGDGRQLRRGVG